jgi:hypothetical protein
VVSEPGAAVIGFVEAVTLDLGAHGSVEQEDARGEEGAEFGLNAGRLGLGGGRRAWRRIFHFQGSMTGGGVVRKRTYELITIC